MTTKEQWKAGILIAGMLVIAFRMNYQRIDRYTTRSPIANPLPPRSVFEQSTTATAASYPKILSIPINRNIASKNIVIEASEEMKFVLYERVPLVAIINGETHTVSPGGNLDFPDGKRYEIAFMIGPGEDVSINEGTVQCTITHR